MEPQPSPQESDNIQTHAENIIVKENNNKRKKDQLQYDQSYTQKVKQHFQQFAQWQVPLDLAKQKVNLEFIKTTIVPLSHKHSEAFSLTLRESLISELAKDKNTEKMLKNSIVVFETIIKNCKECSVNTIIVTCIYQEFKAFWKSHLKEKDLGNLLFPAWKFVPSSLLKQFLNQFNLLQRYQTISLQQFFGFVSSGLFQNKIQQNLDYYKLFKFNRELSEKTKKQFDTFQYDQIVPRITKKDQIFSDYVISLIKEDESIAQKVFECLDMKEYQKVVQLTKKDIRDHPRIIKHAMRKHYSDFVRKRRQWYVIEDKICYSKDYIQWFAKDIAKVFNKGAKKQKSDSENEGEHDYGITSEKQALQIIESMLFRGEASQKGELPYLQNPLYEKDDYIPSQLILSSLSNKDEEKDIYLTLEYLKFSKEEIIVIDKMGKKFQKATQILLNADVIGFDSEFWATTNKYQEGGISIIQLSLRKRCYVFDYHALNKDKQFDEFFIKLLQNPDIVKVGHTISSDLQYLYKTFKTQIKSKSFLDLAKILKKLYPQEIQSSLGFMCEKFIGKKMCKYEQRGNWNRRPLKKTQLAYASLDALVCIHILDKIGNESKLSFKEMHFLENKKVYEEKQGVSQVQLTKKGSDQKQQKWKPELDFDFNKFQEYVKNPIFLIDNMLKKLCSTMRNCGLDAEFISIKDYDLASSQSKKQKRILVTRDSKLLTKRFSHIPIYLLKQKGETDLMFKELIEVFNLDLAKYQALSRCVKCNNSELIVIEGEQAKKEINFVYQDSQITQFWRCTQCKQIYWEGGQFKKAKSKYESLRK